MKANFPESRRFWIYTLAISVLIAIPTFAQNTPESLIVFYRPKRFTGSGLTPSIYLDGQQLARLDNGRFFSLHIAAGKHEITSSMKQAPLPLELKANEAIYLEMVILTGNWRGGGRLIPTPVDEALANINKLKPLDSKWILDQHISFDLKLEVPQPATGDNVRLTATAEKFAFQITSDPPGADVELDGKFVGNARTTLNVTPGDYTLTIRKNGFEVWERKVTALRDNTLHIAAELQQTK